MAFTREVARTPTAIADIEVRLFQPDPTGEETSSVTYNVQVRFDDGSIKTLTGDLLEHLSPARITSLNTFLADLRTKAVAEFLP